MSTMFNDPKRGHRVLVMQRVHDRDCSGHLLRQGGYEHLMLPMRYEPSRLVPVKDDGSPNLLYVPPTSLGFQDPRKEEGELLWPGHFDEPDVARIENALGPYATAGQLQQRPTPRAGGMIQVGRITVVDEVPEGLDLQLLRSWDYAGTDPEKQASLTDPDWTCGVLAGADYDQLASSLSGDPDEDDIFDFDFYILNVVRFRKDPGERDAKVKATAKSDGRGVTVWIEQEPGSAGKSVIFTARKSLAGFSVNPPRVDPMPSAPGQKKPKAKEAGVPSGNKVQRAEPFATHVWRGRVFMLAAAWNLEYTNELEHFPLSSKKDQVDATTQAFLRITERPPSVAELMARSGYYGR